MAEAKTGSRALVALGGRIGRHSAIYGSALAVTVALGLLNVAVLTRFLDPSVFGDLAVLLFFSSLITVALNLGALQGAFRAAYGSTGDGDGDDVLDTSGSSTGGDSRRAMGTAFVYMTCAAAAVVVLAAVFARPLTDALLRAHAASDLVVWAAAAGGLGAVWRLASNILRLDRRPVAWGFIHNSRPALALALAIPLVATGSGPRGVVVGLTFGTGVSLLLALALSFRSYRLAFSRRDLVAIFRMGSAMVPVAAGFWIIQNGDLFVLSRYAAASDVGVYRVAVRVGAMMAYFNSAIFMAWGPMLREPIHAAAEQQEGEQAVVTTLAGIYGVLGIGAWLGLGVFADLIAGIAPGSYSGLAPLIPLTGLAFFMHGAYIATYRTMQFSTKRTAFATLAGVSAVMFAVLALLLVPPLGAYGAVIATGASPAMASVMLIGWGRLKRDDTKLPWRMLGRALLAAAACFGLSRLALQLPSPADDAGRVLAFLLYPPALVATGALSRLQLSALAVIARNAIVPRRAKRAELTSGLRTLSAHQMEALALIVRDGRPVGDVAAESGADERDLKLCLLAGLRTVARIGGEGARVPELADFLVWRGPVAARDELARRLWDEGVDPLEADALASTVTQLRHLPRRAWPDDSGEHRGLGRSAPATAGSPAR